MQSKSKGGKMDFSKYVVVPNDKVGGEKFKKKWTGPRHPLLGGTAKNLARLSWDKMRRETAPSMSAKFAVVKKANEMEKARKAKAKLARETKRAAKVK